MGRMDDFVPHDTDRVHLGAGSPIGALIRSRKVTGLVSDDIALSRPLRRMAAGCLFVLITAVQTGCAATAPRNYDAQLTDVLLTAAMEAESANDYRSAVRHFETLYARDKTNPGVVRDLAKNLRYAGVPIKAVVFLKRNMKSLGRRPELVLELAKAQLAASLLSDVQETLIESRELLPNNWQVHSAWGVFYDRRGKFEKAQLAYRRALELSPNNFAVLNNLALSHALSGDIDKGINTLLKLAKSENTTSLVRTFRRHGGGKCE